MNAVHRNSDGQNVEVNVSVTYVAGTDRIAVRCMLPEFHHRPGRSVSDIIVATLDIDPDAAPAMISALMAARAEYNRARKAVDVPAAVVQPAAVLFEQAELSAPDLRPIRLLQGG